MSTSFEKELAEGERFAFGQNWRRFLNVISESRVKEAERSLQDLLQLERLDGKSFLDVGSGSGLFSLCAHRLGARVHSFDYDPDSVACALELRRRFPTAGEEWRIERGSVLDPDYLRTLDQADVVYSWGVLHHTGRMWQAIHSASELVKPGGLFAIALYNDQGRISRFWHAVKRAYCSGPIGRTAMTIMIVPYFIATGAAADLIRGRNPVRRYTEPSMRGMSQVHDWADWLGGLPFEVARPEAVLQFVRDRGFELQHLITVGGRLGCNQFVFRRSTAAVRQAPSPWPRAGAK